MRRPTWFVAGIAVVFAAWLAWQLKRETPDPMAPVTPPAAPSREPPAMPNDPEVPAAADAVVATREVTSNEAPSDPNATWIVTGTTTRGTKEPYPSVGVRLLLFAGYEATGSPLQEVHVESDADGRFRWQLPPPTTTVTLKYDGDEEGHDSWGGTKTVVGGAPPPDLLVRLFPKDCEVTGIVRDEAGHPIAGAELRGGEDSAKSGEDGRYRIAASSVRAEANVVATARGYAQVRVTAKLAGPGSSAVANFDLVPAFQVSGRVVDEAGAPVEGATLRSFFTGETSATSDADGRFLVDHLDPRRANHSIYARKEGYCEAATNVTVVPSPLALPDLVLTRGVRLEGTVVDDAGAPIAAARLYIGFSPSAYNRLDAVSNDDGSFLFPNVPSGDQLLVTEHPEFAPDRRALALPSPQAAEGLLIELAVAHFIGGVVRDSAGNAKPKVRVSVRHGGDYLQSVAETGADGRFLLKGLPANDVALELFGDGMVRKNVPLAKLDHEGLELVVESSGKVAGRVVDGITGKPLDEFVIRFTRGDDPERTSFGWAATWGREGHRFTGTDGYWDSGSERLTPGGVLGIEARAEGYAPARAGNVVVALAPDPEACLLRMYAGASVRGRIVDADGTPIAAAHIAIRSATDPSRYFSNEPHEAGTTRSLDDGTFAIEQATPGASLLLVQAPRRLLFVDGPFDVPVAGAIDRMIELPRGTTLTGELLAADGRPLPRETIDLHASEVAGVDSYSSATTTDAAGRFEFPGLVDGLYQVSHAVADGDESTYAFTRFARVSAGGKNHVVLQPEGDGSVTGTIVMKDGSAVPPRLPVMVNATPREGVSHEEGPPRRGTFAHDGRFELGALPPGDYSVRVFVMNGVRGLVGSARITVDHDQQEVRIELSEMASRR